MNMVVFGGIAKMSTDGMPQALQGKSKSVLSLQQCCENNTKSY
jgi:hypothetical protein